MSVMLVRGIFSLELDPTGTTHTFLFKCLVHVPCYIYSWTQSMVLSAQSIRSQAWLPLELLARC